MRCGAGRGPTAAKWVPAKVLTFTLLTSVVTVPTLVVKYSQISADAPGKENCWWTHRMGDSVLEDGGSGMDSGVIVGNSHKVSSQLCSRRAILSVNEKNQVELGEWNPTSVLRTVVMATGGLHPLLTMPLQEQQEDLTQTSKESYENDSGDGKRVT